MHTHPTQTHSNTYTNTHTHVQTYMYIHIYIYRSHTFSLIHEPSTISPGNIQHHPFIQIAKRWVRAPSRLCISSNQSDVSIYTYIYAMAYAIHIDIYIYNFPRAPQTKQRHSTNPSDQLHQAHTQVVVMRAISQRFSSASFLLELQTMYISHGFMGHSPSSRVWMVGWLAHSGLLALQDWVSGGMLLGCDDDSRARARELGEHHDATRRCPLQSCCTASPS